MHYANYCCDLWFEDYEQMKCELNLKSNQKKMLNYLRILWFSASESETKSEYKMLTIVQQRRNQRERLRVRAVNEAFARLRVLIQPYEAACGIRRTGKRVSKVKTLRKALEYIRELRKCLNYE